MSTTIQYLSGFDVRSVGNYPRHPLPSNLPPYGNDKLLQFCFIELEEKAQFIWRAEELLDNPKKPCLSSDGLSTGTIVLIRPS